MATLCLFAIILSLAQIIISVDEEQLAKDTAHNAYDPKGWRKAETYLRETMNAKVEPCEDFYEYVCGNYGSQTNSSALDMFLSGKAKVLAKTLIDVIEKVKLDGNPSRYESAVRMFYDQCISLESEPLWPKRLYEAIACRIGLMPMQNDGKQHTRDAVSPRSLSWNLLGKIQREFNAQFLLATRTITFEDAPIKFLLVPVNGLAGLNETVLNETVSLLIKSLSNATVEAQLQSLWTSIMAFYENAKNITGFDRDSFRLQVVSMANISAISSTFDWSAYFSGLLPENLYKKFSQNQDELVAVVFPEQLDAIGKLFEKYHHDTVRSFAFLALFNGLKELFFGEMPEEMLMLTSRVTSAKERCLEFGLRHLSPAIAKIYFKSIDEDIAQWRQDIIMLARNIISGFRFLLNNVEWLDSEDKEKIQRKVDSIPFYPGIPSWIADEDKVVNQIKYDSNLSLFENEIRTYSSHFNKTVHTLFSGKTKNDIEDEDPHPTFEVNAEYSASRGINIYMGLMVPPFYSTAYPLSVKYGGLGSVIGHELMHAFDAHNVYQGASSVQEWLKESALKEFERKKRCVVRQYSTYCYQDKGVCVRGDSTISDNIADIDGLKVAYTAFKFATQVFGKEPPLPGMVNYTEDQIFFMAAARSYCSKGWTEMWSSGPYSHTPPKPRVEMMIRNALVFSRAFSCKVGSKYAPLKRCSIWGDLANPTRLRRD